MDASRALILAPFEEGATATNFVYNESSTFTFTTPSASLLSVSANTLKLQVNNSNLFDAAKADNYVHPGSYGILSIASNVDQQSATSSEFEHNWVDIEGVFNQSAYSRAQSPYRYLRFALAEGFTGSGSSFKSYYWSDRLAPS